MTTNIRVPYILDSIFDVKDLTAILISLIKSSLNYSTFSSGESEKQPASDRSAACSRPLVPSESDQREIRAIDGQFRLH
jgi:hypothetical protein